MLGYGSDKQNQQQPNKHKKNLPKNWFQLLRLTWQKKEISETFFPANQHGSERTKPNVSRWDNRLVKKVNYKLMITQNILRSITGEPTFAATLS